MTFEILSASLYGAGAFIAAFLAMYLVRSNRMPGKYQSSEKLIFLIRAGKLADANSAAQKVLDAIDGPLDPMGKLNSYLVSHFEEVPNTRAAPKAEVREISSIDGHMTLKIKGSEQTLRIEVSHDPSVGVADAHSLTALKTELATLRANARAAPFLLWRQNPSGQITWVNQAYLDAVSAAFGPEKTLDWPPPSLFPKLQTSAHKSSRLVVRNGDKSENWYDCHVSSVGSDLLCTAFNADEAVRSENRRREFTQTLTKTFAELAIGLAIFDRSRSLVLFNPALLDLTSLPTDFLASRPSMVTFLDRLRENRVMPEPRDYRTWRKSIAELEVAAVNGTYSETWSLPDGHTYHVTGRPHPDGAVALLIEDISAEMSLTRRFRAELEQSQSVIDALEDGVAMFSATGQVTQTNAAYNDMWQAEDSAPLLGLDVSDVTRHWHAQSFPTPVWGDFREFVNRTHDREEWHSTVSLRDGRAMLCRFIPQKGGATLAVFRLASSNDMQSDGLQKAV